MGAAVADSIRAILAESDALISHVNERVGASHQDETSDETATALSIADAWNTHLARVIREARLADAARDFRAQWPALVRWRDKVLGNQKRQKPAVIAAAYESLALECSLAGELHLAAKAQQAAIDVIRSRGPKVVPIRPAESSDVAQSA